MTNEQIKQILLLLRKTGEDFTVVQSGKKSGKVNGLYKPDKREIILHTGNFKTTNEMMYTAIHEYAHHIQFTTSAVPISVRAHTTAYWNLFHTLLFEAEQKGLYTNPFDEMPEFQSLTKRIKEKFLSSSGALMKELGKLLLEAHELCEKHGTSYTDYVDRVLAIPRTSAQVIVKAHTLDLDPRVGFENMRTLAAIRDDGARKKAAEALASGYSPDMVKAKFATKQKPKDPREALLQERERIEKSIERLQGQLKEIDKRLSAAEKGRR
jgi:hypothetical protein